MINYAALHGSSLAHASSHADHEVGVQAEWEGDVEAAAEADESAHPISKGHTVIADLCGEGVPPDHKNYMHPCCRAMT